MTVQASQRQARRIAVRAMSDDELVHEAKQMRKRASFAQGMADRMERELSRRRRIRRQAIAQQNRG